MDEQSLVDKTLDRLVDLILVAGGGAKMPAQEALAAQFGVSRTVLREAISKLEFLNVITSRPKIGTMINPPATWKTRNYDVIAWQARARLARA